MIDERQNISIFLKMSSENIFINSGDYIIQTSSELVVKDIIIIKKDGQVIGNLDAKVDFAHLAPELHESAVRMLQGMPLCLHLPSERTPNESPPIVPEDKPVETFWEKIKNIFK